jgi:hypothetical protein
MRIIAQIEDATARGITTLRAIAAELDRLRVPSASGKLWKRKICEQHHPSRDVPARSEGGGGMKTIYVLLLFWNSSFSTVDTRDVVLMKAYPTLAQCQQARRDEVGRVNVRCDAVEVSR